MATTPKQSKAAAQMAEAIRSSRSRHAAADIRDIDSMMQCEITRENAVIPIDMIDKSPYQLRIGDDNVYIEDLASQIADDGLNTPITVRIKPDGRFELIAGHNRLLAFRHLGRTEIAAFVRHGIDDAKAARALTVDNILKKKLTDYETALHIKMLLDNKFAMSAREVGRMFSCSHSEINRLLSFFKLPDAVIRMLNVTPDLITDRVAGQLVTLMSNHDDVENIDELVVQAVTMVSTEKLTAGRAPGWIESKLTRTSRNRAATLPILSLNGDRVARMKTSGRSITIDVENDRLDIAQVQEILSNSLRNIAGPSEG